MDATQAPDGRVVLTMTLHEAVVVRELISYAEFAEDLDVIPLRHPVDHDVMAGMAFALDPLIPNLGTDQYGATIRDAYKSIVSESAGRDGT